MTHCDKIRETDNLELENIAEIRVTLKEKMIKEKVINKRDTKKPYLFLLVFLAFGLIGIGSYLSLNPRGRDISEQALEIGEEYLYLWGWRSPNNPIGSETDSQVFSLALETPEVRESQLRKIANGEYSLERHRARYLLADDLIAKYEGGQALVLLRRLEKNYPLLAPYILLKRGRAYELTNEVEKAHKTWEKLISTYPDTAAAAQALYRLGSYDSMYHDQMISQFPQHPLTQQIVRERLEKNPDQFDLLLLLVKYDYSYSTNQIRDRLVTEYNSELSSSDWHTIGAGYWQNGEYRKAADAYRYGQMDPRSIYRTARGLHLNGNMADARQWYKKVIIEFPDAQETALALEHLATLSEAKASLFYLDLLIKDFPQQAATALYRKAIILDYLNSYQSAEAARQRLLEEYGDSEAAAEYRWNKAQTLAQAGNKREAIAILQPLIEIPSSNDISPKALFWAGKWAMDVGDKDTAQAAFEHVLSYNWQSYYAWRSAVFLGWDVGDFDSVRSLHPEVIMPTTRPVPPGGSKTFAELFLLNQDTDAIYLFEFELGNRQNFSVAEQFTEGLLKLHQGEYRQAVNLIWSLKLREEERERLEWRQLRQTDAYWQALFPFPYYETILDWSNTRDLNPLLVISLIRQESTFEVDARSPVGATGLMQVMPTTGEWIADILDIKSDYSLLNPEDNIILGSWYLDHTHKQYKNNSLFAVASYNAGPGNVNKWTQRYSLSDLDVFVENIPFPETEGYVKSVFGNYWNYLRIYNPQISQLVAQQNHSQK